MDIKYFESEILKAAAALAVMTEERDMLRAQLVYRDGGKHDSNCDARALRGCTCGHTSTARLLETLS